MQKGLKKVAAMIILQYQDQYLLMKRAFPPNAGMYLPVGGKLKPFEDPRSAVIRECREETGILIEHPTFCGILTESSPDKYNWISYIYHAEIDYQAAPTSEEGLLEWIPAHQLDQLPTPPTDLSIYQFVRDKQPFILNAIYNENLKLTAMYDELSGKILHYEGA